MDIVLFLIRSSQGANWCKVWVSGTLASIQMIESVCFTAGWGKREIEGSVSFGVKDEPPCKIMRCFPASASHPRATVVAGIQCNIFGKHKLKRQGRSSYFCTIPFRLAGGHSSVGSVVHWTCRFLGDLWLMIFG